MAGDVGRIDGGQVMQNPEDLTAPASWDRPPTMEPELKLDVARRDWLPQCLEATIRTCELIEEGVIPEVLHGFMLRSTAMRLLRCIYGDDLTAAAAIREHVLRDAAREQEIVITPPLPRKWTVGDRSDALVFALLLGPVMLLFVLLLWAGKSGRESKW